MISSAPIDNSLTPESPVPAGHDGVEAHPELVERLQDPAGHGGLQQQRHAGRDGLGVRDQVPGGQQRQVLQDPHQPGAAGRKLLEGWPQDGQGVRSAAQCSEATL